MLKTLAIVGVLASSLAASCAANAAPQTWSFTYAGFYDENTYGFDFDHQINGTFSGSDDNHDGVIDKSELTEFIVNGIDYVGCSSGNSPYSYCGTDRFSYQLGGALDFSAGTANHDAEYNYGGGYVIRSGLEETDYRFTPYSYNKDTAYVWTEETQFSIRMTTSGGVTPPIPEPGTWAMVLTGLALVAGAARRRKGQSAPIAR